MIVSAWISDEEHRKLVTLRSTRGWSSEQIIREALREYFDREFTREFDRLIAAPDDSIAPSVVRDRLLFYSLIAKMHAMLTMYINKHEKNVHNAE